MKSSIAVNFSGSESVAFGDYSASLVLNISNSYWPPMVDIDYLGDITQVTGPMMAVLIEICRKLNIRCKRFIVSPDVTRKAFL